MDSTSECLLALHWLPIHSRINHKILTLVPKCIMGSAPEYLQNLLVVHRPSRPGLRSALDTNLLVIPFVRHKTFAKCSFSIHVPTMWNSLPEVLRSETDTDVFKRKLKTHLFYHYNKPNNASQIKFLNFFLFVFFKCFYVLLYSATKISVRQVLY